MGPVLLKLLRGAILGSHEPLTFRFARDGRPVEVSASPFSVILGLFAKFADGGSGDAEAGQARAVEEILLELDLPLTERQEAIELFGAAREWPLSYGEMLLLCREFSASAVWMRAVLVSYLFRLAHAGGEASEPSVTRLQEACAALGRDFQESLAFFNEEREQKAAEKRRAAAKMDVAYGVLGIGGEEPLDVIKRRYRVLAKELHPDIVAAKGLAKEEVQSSVERFQEIHDAYQFVLLQRGPE